MTAEEKRLEESRNRHSHWKRWGPYVSERAWGLCAKTTANTVRRGSIFRTTIPGPRLIAGMRMGLQASQTVTSVFAFQ